MNTGTSTTQTQRTNTVSFIANAVLTISTAIFAFLYLQATREIEAQKSSVVALQTELAKEAARTAEVKSDLNASRTAVMSLAEKTTQMQTIIASNEATISQEKSKAESVQAALDKEKARLPSVPVRIEMRRSNMGKGLVAMFTNTSAKHLQLLVVTHNPTTKASNQFTIQISPGRKSELGHQEGWAFASGDLVQLRSAGYEDVRQTVP